MSLILWSPVVHRHVNKSNFLRPYLSLLSKILVDASLSHPASLQAGLRQAGAVRYSTHKPKGCDISGSNDGECEDDSLLRHGAI
jgi:hypothetical protein